MRHVHRASIAAPASLQPGGAGPAELIRARAHIVPPIPPGTTKKSFEYAAYKKDDVRIALDQLFHGKCAYCETSYAASAPVDIEHYRPKGGVSEEPTHGGYWWIAMQWENLLSSCIDCNRKRGQRIVEASTSLGVLAAATLISSRQSGKHDSFPLAPTGVRATAETTDFSREHPLLINPCDDDPATCLMHIIDPALPTGLLVPVGDQEQQARGATSIQTYGLNRLKLFEDRNRLLRTLEFLGDLVIDLTETIVDLETPAVQQRLIGTPAVGVSARLRLLRDRLLAELKTATAPEAPYATMASAWVEQFKLRLIH